MGLGVLCDGRRAFVNCARDRLVKELVMLLPSTTTVVEVRESVPADPEVVAACRSLKEVGYMIALDDYVAGDPREPLGELADIIKVEMPLTAEDQRVRLLAAVGAEQNKTSDLVLSALVRGRFGELIAPKVQHGESDLFLLGLLSLIDAMLEMPMEAVLEKFYWISRLRRYC